MTKGGPARGRLETLTVRAAPRLPGDHGPRGHVKVGTVTLTCALGQTGLSRRKREGDRATPTGTFPILYGFYRADRLPRPRCAIPLHPTPADLGWCDEPASALYNRPQRLPIRGSHETMTRSDGLYDVVLVLDYNLAPRRARYGSAVFLHCAKPGLPPTLGCVALRPADMRRLLPRLARTARLVVL
jgi:L,D-peptidoglycan transpeptidase YkuD (ErfK/YbiS/YcfS/YnhG family)